MKRKCPKCQGSGQVRMSKSEAETMWAVASGATAAEAAINLQTSIGAAYNRLERLADAGILKRHKKPGTSRGSFYVPA